MRSFDRLGLAVAIAMILASFTLTPLTVDRSYLGPSWLLIALITGVGVALRRIGVSGVAVVAGQLMIWTAFVFSVSTFMPGEGGSSVDHLAFLGRSAVEHMQTQSAPMSPDDGVRLMMIAAVGLMALLTDLIAVGLSRPAWALAPALALYLVPAVGIGRDAGIVSFLLVGVGYLGLLAADGLNRAARWTRGLSRDSAEGYGTVTPVVWRSAAAVGSGALAVTIGLGSVLPTVNLPGIGIGTGSGGSGPLQLADPTLDLRRNLNQPRDITVLQYTTDGGDGDDALYLRMASLPQFSGAGWANAQMQLTTGQTLSPIPGLAVEPSRRRTTTISILDFGAEYLPLPYATRSFNAAGEWGYDSDSLMVLSTARGDRRNAIRNLTYTVQSVDVEPDANDLAAAPAGTPVDAQVTSVVPPDLPQSLRDLTQQVTADATTPAQRAAAIQAYLRSSEFTYSTRPLPGTGYQALENFLLGDKTGYCEQFAAAMAMMARVSGIPSRVAVGFLPGEKVGDSWRVSVRRMHAWPELYFSGLGWVRFEPTPGSVTGVAPDWTQQPATAPSEAPSTDVSTSASVESTLGPDVPSAEAPSEAPTTATDAFDWSQAVLTSGVGLAVLVVLALPATLRLRRRSARLSVDLAAEERLEAAWAEIRDTVIDFGARWPQGSPRTIGREMADRLDQPGAEAISQVALLVERCRYGRPTTFGSTALRSAPAASPTADFTVDPSAGTSRGGGRVDLLERVEVVPSEQTRIDDPTRSVAALTAQVRRSLAEPQPRLRRLLAFVLPRSLFRRIPKG